MAADSSFDIVSKVDRQEVDNALNQAAKEISQRFDFKNTDTSIAWRGDNGVEISANAEERALAALDVFKGKLIKRGVSLKALETGEPRQSGREVKIDASLSQGISQEQAKKIGKLIRDEGPKGSRCRSRATSCGSPARSATTCRRSSRWSRPRTTTSPCSS